jgi:hypothetical protein
VTLPLPLRNRLADLILDALHDRAARRGLEALAAVCADPRALGAAAPPAAFPADLFEKRGDAWTIRPGHRQHEHALGARASRAARALAGAPLGPADPPLEALLDEAAILFEAGLYFEVHELLEPSWMRADGVTRQILQGLIQVAVGFQHLANQNMDGARALLREGAAKLLGRQLAGRDLDEFARAVIRGEREVERLGGDGARRFDWSAVPRWPGR